MFEVRTDVYRDFLLDRTVEKLTRIRRAIENRTAAKAYGKPAPEPETFADKEVRELVLHAIRTLRPVAANVPGAQAKQPRQVDLGAVGAGPVMDQMSGVYGQQRPGDISLAWIWESHDSQQDEARAQALIPEMVPQGRLSAVNVLVFERGLAAKHRPFPPNLLPTVVREEDLTTVTDLTPRELLPEALSRVQRNIVVAGYLLLALAGGDQREIANVVTIFGERHDGLVGEFEYLAKATNVTGIDTIGKRPRGHVTVASHV